MTNERNELMGIVVIQAVTKLLKLNHKGKVTWSCIAKTGGAKLSNLDDFRKVNKALSNHDFHGSFIISLDYDGTAMVGWNTNKKIEEIE